MNRILAIFALTLTLITLVNFNSYACDGNKHLDQDGDRTEETGDN